MHCQRKASYMHYYSLSDAPGDPSSFGRYRFSSNKISARFRPLTCQQQQHFHIPEWQPNLAQLIAYIDSMLTLLKKMSCRICVQGQHFWRGRGPPHTGHQFCWHGKCLRGDAAADEGGWPHCQRVLHGGETTDHQEPQVAGAIPGETFSGIPRSDRHADGSTQ